MGKYKNFPCAVCGGTGFKKMFVKKDESAYLKRTIDVHVSRCKKCGMIMSNPRIRDVYSLYNKSYYEDEFKTMKKADKENLVEISAKAFRRIEKISGKTEGRLLDIGCGSGLFLSGVRQANKNWELHGMDMMNCLETDIRQNVSFHKGIIETASFRRCNFDVATMIEVAEHLPDPIKSFRAINRILKPSGWIFISTSNLDSLSAKIRGASEGYYKAPHVSYWSPRTIRQCLEKCGFRVAKITGLYNGFWTTFQKTKKPGFLAKAVATEVLGRANAGDNFLLGGMNVFAQKTNQLKNPSGKDEL